VSRALCCALSAVLRPELHRLTYSLCSHRGSFTFAAQVLTLFTSFVAFLLTLRTNHSLSRLLEGRLAWGRCVLMTRNLSQLIHAYIYPVNPQLGLQCARHLSLFGWTLKARMRVEPDDDVIDAMLEKVDGDYVKLQRKRPVALLTRIRQVGKARRAKQAGRKR